MACLFCDLFRHHLGRYFTGIGACIRFVIGLARLKGAWVSGRATLGFRRDGFGRDKAARRNGTGHAGTVFFRRRSVGRCGLTRTIRHGRPGKVPENRLPANENTARLDEDGPLGIEGQVEITPAAQPAGGHGPAFPDTVARIAFQHQTRPEAAGRRCQSDADIIAAESHEET